MLRLPDFSKEFVLQTDACNDGIGGILLQEEDGVKHPVAFASKKLLPRQCYFSTIERMFGYCWDSSEIYNDIQREIRSMFVRCNLLICKFQSCSKAVKLRLFQSFCLCFYDIALWTSYHKSYLQKFRSCYNKCVKAFFRYKKYDSVTVALFETRVLF